MPVDNVKLGLIKSNSEGSLVVYEKPGLLETRVKRIYNGRNVRDSS